MTRLGIPCPFLFLLSLIPSFGVAAEAGSIRGRVEAGAGFPLREATVSVAGSDRVAFTDWRGEFLIGDLPGGEYRLLAEAEGFRAVEITPVPVGEGRAVRIEPIQLEPAGGAARLDPFVVEARLESVTWDSAGSLLTGNAADNLDLARTEDGALPFTIFDRDRIARSGFVDLNDFLRRELLEGEAAIGAPDTSIGGGAIASGSSNLKLRGYAVDETVVLVNGRRLPEVLTNLGNGVQPPDVNFIPLSLVQRVEVLPLSASSLYGGNAVGGVINIVLRPEAENNASEVTATYTDALDGSHSPARSLALMHAHTLLGGALRFRVSANFSDAQPPVESELGLRGAAIASGADTAPFRATPNVRSADGFPLFGAGTSSFASMAPGAAGSGGIAAFAGREGVAATGLFDSPEGRAVSLYSVDLPYGRQQRRGTLYGTAVIDLTPWLQLGIDGTRSRLTSHRGLEVFADELPVPAGSPHNPFGKDVVVALQETPAELGANFGESRIDFSSVVLGAAIRLPAGWRLTLDAQRAHNISRYRGLAGVDRGRWHQLVADGRYNPFRDTQAHGPPDAFYREALVHYGMPGSFVTLGDFTSIDASARLTKPVLPLPTGAGILNAGVDYRRTNLGDFLDERRFGDGSTAGTPVAWDGRTLQRYSAFGELQAPLVPTGRLPDWMTKAEANLAVRYVAADTAEETNLSPTLALRLDFAAGISARASFTTASRFPTPFMSRPAAVAGGGVGSGGAEPVLISDPRRGEQYVVNASEVVLPGLLPESAVTQSVGIALNRGSERRLRLAIDFVDTRKSDESIVLDASGVVNLEGLFPERVFRDPAAPGDPGGVGRITSVLTGRVNAAWRQSRSLTTTAAWEAILPSGGLLEIHGRWVQLLTFERQLRPDDPVIDQLATPDSAEASLIRHRATLGTSWSRQRNSIGVDLQYLHSRNLPLAERPSQGSDRIGSYWQLDAFVVRDFGFLAQKLGSGTSLQGQIRINNLLGTDYPDYASHPSGARIQPYGDWRGRTASLSVTVGF
jgi:iron complex outermembrane receptor protein